MVPKRDFEIVEALHEPGWGRLVPTSPAGTGRPRPSFMAPIHVRFSEVFPTHGHELGQMFRTTRVAAILSRMMIDTKLMEHLLPFV